MFLSSGMHLPIALHLIAYGIILYFLLKAEGVHHFPFASEDIFV